jgi:hypothetical protein
LKVRLSRFFIEVITIDLWDLDRTHRHSNFMINPGLFHSRQERSNASKVME